MELFEVFRKFLFLAIFFELCGVFWSFVFFLFFLGYSGSFWFFGFYSVFVPFNLPDLVMSVPYTWVRTYCSVFTRKPWKWIKIDHEAVIVRKTDFGVNKKISDIQKREKCMKKWCEKSNPINLKIMKHGLMCLLSISARIRVFKLVSCFFFRNLEHWFWG